MKHKSVITGFGVKLPRINNSIQLDQILKNGICTHSIVNGLGPGKESLVCGIIDEELEEEKEKELRGYPRAALLGIAAAKEAMQMGIFNYQNARIAVIMGTSTSSLPEIERGSFLYRNNQYRKISPFHAGMTNIHSLSSGVANYFGLGDGNLVFTLTNGCSSGTDALFLGKTLIENGTVDLCLVGAAETPLCDSAIASFAKQKALKFNAQIGETGNPFSKKCNTFVISEGAAVVVLEAEQQAKKENKRIHGYITGAAANNDGVNIHRMDNKGERLYKTFEEAVGNKEISFTNSLALGLDIQDSNESANHIKKLGHHTPITSIKGMIGHSFATSGVVQVISSLLSIRDNYIPGTILSDFKGYEHVNIVKETRYCDIRHVAVTSHGFGGNNNTIVVSREG
ncbi:3-oxoacyl-ACP synthase [Paenibacillus baekrokdamisoli]|uniref:3-oxoacyl-ACP synthase n=1 Tax=Paenibacillus baekrokdamisoli TaxID=1712516 RepID=A0A3G9IKX7_9BACL|nr:beta-ketoacyl synthase N-terminal-like domain-containing protein [Paenibacillus baekrokdamisoli]MBB3069194.1 3-oxoacyl-[acyl-carrier-protein] synthase II [Paenibacillus baekrokdamisoli]BBH18832.1 3-oxoacyl-ACP synthase [Paenibacillus baekrokdamisoli]